MEINRCYFFRITLGLDDYFNLMIIIFNFGIQIDIGEKYVQ